MCRARTLSHLNKSAMEALNEGDLMNAEFLLSQALRHARSMGVEAFAAKLENNIGLVLREKGNDAAAEKCFRSALGVIEKKIGKENKLYASVLSNLHSVSSAVPA